MTPEIARQALRRLSVLLRRKGTSPELGKALRRAVAELDGVLMAKAEPERGMALESAIAELSSCIELIKASNRPADGEQLPGVSEALALLISARPPEPPAPVFVRPEPAPARPAPSPIHPVPTPQAHRSPTPPTLPPTLERPKKPNAVISALLAKLDGLYLRRRSLLGDPLSVWRNLEAVDQQVDDAMSSIHWITDDIGGYVAARFARAEDPAELFASALAMLRSGAAEPVLRFLTRESPRSDPDANGVLMALRTCPGDSSMTALKASFLALDAKIQTGVLSALADRGDLSRDWLLGALDDEDDAAAIRAAEVLAWLGRSPEDTQAVEARAFRDAPVARRSALLFAAVALGSGRALAEIRGMLDAAAPLTDRVIDALAVAGGPSDAPRLLDLAARQPELAARAVLAAGHLGDASCAKGISGAQVKQDVKNSALRAILGESPLGSRPKDAGRRLHGEPWTMAGALARLNAPDELLLARGWHALEIGVRFGRTPQSFLDAEAPANQQKLTTERIRAAGAAARQTRTMAAGKWLFFGQPIN